MLEFCGTFYKTVLFCAGQAGFSVFYCELQHIDISARFHCYPPLPCGRSGIAYKLKVGIIAWLFKLTPKNHKNEPSSYLKYLLFMRNI
jgi:hypothetical protein